METPTQVQEAYKTISDYRLGRKRAKAEEAKLAAIAERRRRAKHARIVMIAIATPYVLMLAVHFWQVSIFISGLFTAIFAWRLSSLVGPYLQRYLEMKARKNEIIQGSPNFRVNYNA